MYNNDTNQKVNQQNENYKFPQVKWSTVQELDRQDTKIKSPNRFGRFHLRKPQFRKNQEWY